jgi:Family of unknown function (DUF6299)
MAAAAALVIGGGMLTPAEAAVPSNDDWQSATRISSSYKAVVDTREATRDADAVGQPCYDSPGHSVWFRFAPAPRDRSLIMSTVGSSYGTVLTLFRVDAPDDWALVWCDDRRGGNDRAVIGPTLEAGSQYLLMASADPGSAGGKLRLSVRKMITAQVTLAGAGHWDKITGSAVLRGTYRCNRSGRVFIHLHLRQRVGDIYVAYGEGTIRRACDTKKEDWRMRIDSFTQYSFQKGAARVSHKVWQVCEEFGCRPGRFERDLVQLR